jgi:Protein of unknown function (DUF3455)
MGANSPKVLATTPNAVLQYPSQPAVDRILAPANLAVSGHHYFSPAPNPANASIPTFNLDLASATGLTGHSWGILFSKKLANSTAPADSPKGVDGEGFGSVVWLKLVDNGSGATTDGYKEVYRINTAGGNPPATCDGMDAKFEVPYAAEYWLYT